MKVARNILITITLCAALYAEATAATQQQIDTARANGLAWLIRNQNGDGSWQMTSGLKVQPTAAVLEALMKAGIKQGYPYSSGIAWLGNADSPSVDSLARQIGVLSRSGQNVDTLVKRLNAMVHGYSKSWGAYSGYYGSFPDTSLALDALLTTNTPLITYAATTASFITGKQLSVSSADNSYGWSYMGELTRPTETTTVSAAKSRVIPTSHNLVVLSHYKRKSSTVDTNITRGLTWLLRQQKADGGFTDDIAASVVNGNIYETALATLALTEAAASGNSTATGATAALANAQDFLINKQQADGSWGGDPLQTALALQALPAPSATLSDMDRDGAPDVVEAILGTNPLVADTRQSVEGNGEGGIGITAPALVATVLQHHSFSETLTPKGGTAPYTWSILSGSLPDGFTLSATSGTVSGTPLIAGIFNFIYQVTDTVGINTATVGKIEVEPLYPAVAAFAAVPTTVAGPFAVKFTDQSQRAMTWQWDFGDGTTSTEQSPTHTYQARGTYTVALTAINPSGSSTVSKRVVDFIDLTPIIMMILED
ncbi:Collagenase ColH [Anaerolineales bacterium]|nr:Collagenase ColH [Anaerolineales bacterium]